MRHDLIRPHRTRVRALARAAIIATGSLAALGGASLAAAVEGQVRLQAVQVLVPGTSGLRANALRADGTVGGSVNVGGSDRGFLWNDGNGVVSHPATGAVASTIVGVTDIGVGAGWSTMPGGSQRPTRFARSTSAPGALEVPT